PASDQSQGSWEGVRMMRRQMRVSIVACCLGFLTATLLAAPSDQGRPKRRGPVELTEEALRIHREAIVVDGHNDLPWMFREKEDLSFRSIDIRKPQKDLHTDLPR